MESITLSAEQDAIIRAPHHHYVVTAVAGSGKTTTLAHRIRHLLQEGTDRRRILVLMFNRAARDDFSQRMQRVLGKEMSPEVRTFHAMGYRLYQRFVQEGQLPAFNQKILSDKEMLFQLWRLTCQLLKPEQLNPIKRVKQEHMELCGRFIEAVKSQLATPEQVFTQLALEERYAYFVPLFEKFEQWRRQNRRISYADMLYEPVRALQNSPELRQLVANKMDSILVDEYQDTNAIQHELLKLIAGERAKIMVVGDPDQTIYEFRGARPEYMLKGFAEEFPDADSLTLSHSFRYGHQVSLLANHLIRHNRRRRDVLCKSATDNPDTRVSLHTQHKDTAAILGLLQSLSADQQHNSAILLRVWSQSVAIELALLDQGIPYRLEGQAGVFSATETRCLRSLLEVMDGRFFTRPIQTRQQALYELLRFPHVGLGDSELQHLAAHLAENQSGLGQHLMSLLDDKLKQIQRVKLSRLGRALDTLEHRRLPVHDALDHYMEETELYEGIRSLGLSREHAEEKIMAVKDTIRFIKSLPGDAGKVLERLDILQQQSGRNSSTGVLLTTLHRAKGREWSRVIIPGINDLYYPYMAQTDKDIDLDKHIESERRLLYVGITRAKHHLDLFVPGSRSTLCPGSRFTQEMQPDFCLRVGEALHRQRVPKVKAATQSIDLLRRYVTEAGLEDIDYLSQIITEDKDSSKLPETDGTPIWSHSRVKHDVFGEGAVTAEGHSSFTVAFESDDSRVFSKETAAQYFSVCES